MEPELIALFVVLTLIVVVVATETSMDEAGLLTVDENGVAVR